MSDQRISGILCCHIPGKTLAINSCKSTNVFCLSEKSNSKCKRESSHISNSGVNSMNKCSIVSSFYPPALTSMSEPRGLKTQPTIQEGKVVRWAPAQCTTWHTVCTNSTTSSRSGVPLLTRSAHRDMAGGVDLSQTAESH